MAKNENATTLAENTEKLCMECGKERAFANKLCKKCYSRAYYRRKNNPANEMDFADLEPKTPIAKVTMEMLLAENCSLMAMVDRLLVIVERQRKVMEAL